MQSSKILKTMELIVISLKSSGTTLHLLPLNLGIGATRPTPKSLGTSLRAMIILKIDLRIEMTDGWAHLKCSIHMSSIPGVERLAILLIAISIITVVIEKLV